MKSNIDGQYGGDKETSVKRTLGIVGIVICVLMLAFLIACSSEAEPYAFTQEQVAQIDEGVNENLLSVGFDPLSGDHYMTICNNFRLADWDFDLAFERMVENDANEFSKYAHSAVVTELGFYTTPDQVEDWDTKTRPSYMAGYCAHKLDG